MLETLLLLMFKQFSVYSSSLRHRHIITSSSFCSRLFICPVKNWWDL